MYNKIFLLFLLLLFALSSFAKKASEEKPKYLWFDASANFERFSSKDSITYYLEKTKSVGFNQIVVDVKPNHGHVLYNSKILPTLTTIRGKKVERDWDYLQYFIDEARRLGLKITVSTAMFTAGYPSIQEGLVYENNFWDNKTCLEYVPNVGMLDIRKDHKKVAAFLNPIRKDVREFALSIVREIVENYDIDAYALDYCRYPSDNSDFSNETRKAFEIYLKEKIRRFPDDVFTWNEDGSKKPGPYYKKWWAFRSSVISNFVKEVQSTIKKINKNIKLEYWAASWIHGIYGQGQNWASPQSNFSLHYPSWGSEEYNKTGFAPYIDTFLCGTYLNKIYGVGDPESIEFGLARAKNLIGGDCHLLGTIYALNHRDNIADAVTVCLEQSEGLMVFDIVQVIEMNLWNDIKRGIERNNLTLKGKK